VTHAGDSQAAIIYPARIRHLIWINVEHPAPWLTMTWLPVPRKAGRGAPGARAACAI